MHWSPWLLCGSETLVWRQCREAQVQVGVLQHLTGNAEEAWQELGHAAERIPEVGHLSSGRLLVYTRLAHLTSACKCRKSGCACTTV